MLYYLHPNLLKKNISFINNFMKNMEVEINVLGFESDGIGSLLDE